MKLLTDRRDLGLADGLIIFLFAIYFLREAVLNIGVNRTNLTVLVLAFLYLVTLFIHNVRTKEDVKESNLELLD